MSIYASVENLLRVSPESKPQVYLKLHESAAFSVNYVIELLLAAGIATFGLVLNSPAVVIGAMLVSPLMGPILATGLALAASDLYLAIKCVLNLAASILVAVFFSGVLVWALPFHSPTSEILARTQPNLLDLGVAVFSGLAGSLVMCRGGGGGGVTALPGVSIAVALMPPLCTVGFGVGTGFDWAIVSGAGLLFLTNLAAIIACAFGVFLAVRMGSMDVRKKLRLAADERATHERLYTLLHRTRLASALEELGQMRWRVVMLLVTLGVLFVPLSKALLQVRDETISRTAVRDAIRILGPQDSFLSRQVDVFPDRILARLVSTNPVDQAKVQQAEREVIARTGRQTTFSVRQVASQEEISILRAQLAAPAPAPPPPPQDLRSIGEDVVGRLRAPLEEAWPAELATLDGYEIGFGADGVVAHIKYTAQKPLDASAEEVLMRVLRSRLEVEQLQLVMERTAPPRGKRK